MWQIRRALVLAAALVLSLASPLLALRAGMERARGLPWRRVAVASLAALLVLLPLCLTHMEARKLVGMLLMPEGLLWLGLGGLAAGLAWSSQGRWALAAGALWLLFTVGGNVWVGANLVRILEHQLPLPDEAATYEAVFILGGGTAIGPTGPELTGSGDRLRVAARLYHQGRTPLLVVSGHSVPSMEVPRDLARESTALLADFGVPASAVVQLSGEEQSNTLGELRAYQELIHQRGWKRVGLVSSAWHLPRATRICRRLGLEMTPLPSEWRGGSPLFSAALLIPKASGFLQIQGALWELLGSLADG